MHVAIDIGAYKTRIYSSEDGGTVVFDEYGKRDFPTVLALTAPLRAFGKGVSGDSPKDILLRKRGFFHDISRLENQKHLLMYLEYIGRILSEGGRKYEYSVLVIPEGFTEKERSILASVVGASSLNVRGFITHVTSVAACAALRNAEYPEKFMIFDFGYHKSSAGLFEYKNNVLTPVYRGTITVGAADFDDAMYLLISKKYNLPYNIVIRERILQVMDKMKRGLNDLESVNASILDDELNEVSLVVTKSEFLEAAAEAAAEIKAFVDRTFEETGFDGKIEVVGNNINSIIIKRAMEGRECKTLLNPGESAALGACLAFGVNAKNAKYKVEEIIGSEISMRVKKEASAEQDAGAFYSAVVFRPSSTRNHPVKVEYNRRNPFSVDILENGTVIGTVSVNKKASEEPTLVKIAVEIDGFNMVNIRSVTSEGEDIPYVYSRCFTLDDQTIEAIKASENDYSVVENEFLSLGRLRHETETFIDTFISRMDKTFPGLLSPADKARIDDITDAFFARAGATYEDEQAIKAKLLDDLQFVQAKLTDKYADIEKTANETIRLITPYIKSYRGPNSLKFHKINNYMGTLARGFQLNLETFSLFSQAELSSMVNEAFVLVKRQEEEEARAARQKEEEEAARQSGQAAQECCAGGCECAARADEGSCHCGPGCACEENEGGEGDEEKQPGTDEQ